MEPESPAGAQDPKAIVTDFIARKEHARAIEFLRGEFKGRSPGPRLRLELADVLLLAGRRDQAVPILMEVTDELLARGNVATAIAALKKVEQAETEGKLERRLAALLGREVAPAPSPEHVDEKSDTQPVSSGGGQGPAEGPPAPDEDLTAPVLLTPELVAAREAMSGEVGGRIRTAFRRFLATLPGRAEEGEDGERPAEEGAEEVSPPDLGTSPAAEAKPAEVSLPTMSAEDFRTELLRLVKDLAQRRSETLALAPEPQLPGEGALERSPRMN